MTTTQAIGTIILRIGALYLIITKLPVAVLFAVEYFEIVVGEDPQVLLPGFLYQSGILLAGLLLFILSGPIGRLIAPSTEKSGKPPVTGEELVCIGSFLIGILLLAWQLPGFVLGTAQAALEQMRNLDGYATSGFWVDMWRAAERIVFLAIGAWLTLRPAHLAGLYRSLRTAGLPPAESESPGAGRE